MENIIMWVSSVITTTPARWDNMAKSLPAELFTLKPDTKEWSALECLVHIIDTEQIFHSRLKAFLAGQDFPAFNPETQGTKPGAAQSPAELAAHFSHLRKESLSTLASITTTDLERKVRHAELGMVSLKEMLNEWAGHDLNHTVQAERALMQPFIRGCGPWQPYFADHAIK